MDDKQQNFYKRLLINILVNCLKQGIKKSEFCLKQGRKISDICLKQGQGNWGRAAPPHQEIYRVPPPPGFGRYVVRAKLFCLKSFVPVTELECSYEKMFIPATEISVTGPAWPLI